MKTRTMATKNRKSSQGQEEGGDLKELFIEELKDLYNAESQLVKALPKLAKAANSQELKDAFEEHLQVTNEQVNRLEKIFGDLSENPGGVKCEGMKGLIAEGEEKIKEKQEDPVLKDLALIGAAQKAEHYEIAGYGTVRTYAENMGLEEAVDLLQQSLDEEGEADKTLTGIAENLMSQAGQGSGSGMGTSSSQEDDLMDDSQEDRV